MREEEKPELRQVLKGLALTRQPGWNFAGNFLEISFDAATENTAITSLDPGPHCVDPDGQISLAALIILIDIGLAPSLRKRAGLATRMATVNLSIQFTGHQRRGRLVAHGTRDGATEGTASSCHIIRQQVMSETGLVATASGSFIELGNSRGLQPIPIRQRGVDYDIDPLDIAVLTPEESVVYARARHALGGTDGSFLNRFLGITPSSDIDGGSCVVTNGLHMGNRVGHLQGGIAMAIAGLTAAKALDDTWSLTGISAFFLEGGSAPHMMARAEILRRGNLTATTRSRITDESGKVIVETITTHVRKNK